mgnify:CR=1 FL=1
MNYGLFVNFEFFVVIFVRKYRQNERTSALLVNKYLKTTPRAQKVN